MDESPEAAVERFAQAAADYCAWATGPADADLSSAACLLAELLTAGLGIGIGEGEPCEVDFDPGQTAAVRARVAALPIQFYGEVFDCLAVPAEEPCLGDLTDDLIDIHAEVAPGLALWEAGRHRDATEHWRWSMRTHWGRHASSALRVMCCALVDGAPA
jgi:hypothetical protein